MRRLVFLAMFFVFSPFILNSWGADWKLVGGNAPKGGDTFAFYDDESVDRPTDWNIKVWVKSIKKSSLEKGLDMHKEKITKAASEKIARDYRPPWTTIENPETFDNVIDIILLEEAAKLPDIKPESTVLFELNCQENKLRPLSVWTSNKDRELHSSEPGNWDYAMPESTGERLIKLLCKPIKVKGK